MAEIKFILVQSRDLQTVKDYLPSNYFPFFARSNHIVVVGQDDHGWTAEEYVIPRLLSGLIPAYRIFPQDYVAKYGVDLLNVREPKCGKSYFDRSLSYDRTFTCLRELNHSGPCGPHK